MFKKFLYVGLFVAVLAACERKVEIPEGFVRIAAHGAYHFVYIDPKVVSTKDKVLLRRGGINICKFYGNDDYCEVYMWDKPELVSTKLPVENRRQVAVIYTIKGDEIKLKIIK